MPQIPKLRIWEMLPVDSEAINAFVDATAGAPSTDLPPPSGIPGPGEAVPAAGLQTFGSYTGSFTAQIKDEESKINVNKLNNLGAAASATGLALLGLLNDPRWNFLFERENSLRERISREDMVIRLRDWITSGNTSSTLNPTTPMNLFGQGFGDKEGMYTRYTPRYKPKNALFDSLEEVYLVAGVTDAFMAAFGDRLTVFPDVNAKLNVNTDDQLQLLMCITLAAANPNDPALSNPLVIEMIKLQIQMVRPLPILAMSVEQFVAILEANGIAVRPEIKHNPKQNEFLDDSSGTFRIQATGQVGNVTKTLVTVVRSDEGLGRVLYYREE
ncbi:type II secretion system protein GspK [Vulgatibacter incomptus]|uniref:General secretion pathway protein K n=1 Tax=Vulgatibacter incomptus TaxID=1391653 RepID=A0A0K1PCR4_9BACT|nr:type II secretion system protein GspK [Vulgatibacter incomptus]AKU91328.1 hypothetical protein AKJ08_1715 [Vulgatibacter incomptus]